MGGTWNYLDITALGRQEEWEDSPEGYPQTCRTSGGRGATRTATMKPLPKSSNKSDGSRGCTDRRRHVIAKVLQALSKTNSYR